MSVGETSYHRYAMIAANVCDLHSCTMSYPRYDGVWGLCVCVCMRVCMHACVRVYDCVKEAPQRLTHKKHTFFIDSLYSVLHPDFVSVLSNEPAYRMCKNIGNTH